MGSDDVSRAVASLGKGSENAVTPRQFAEWCCEVERIHEQSWVASEEDYLKSYRQAVRESSVPEAWREIVGLLVWKQTFCELWDWCEEQGVRP